MNIVKFGKKALTSTVVASTILWSMSASIIAGPLTATAAVTDGTLIKAKEVEAVYYYTGGKRYTFPNLKTYKSWFKDFSGVVTVPLSELQTYQLAGNVVYRAGTRLVKITTDPKVYAVAPSGQLRWVKDEATAKALYGTNWAKLVDDVSDAFFTNYTIGADIATAVYPDGALLSNGGNYYYVEGGAKRLVDSAALTGNKFNTAYAIAVADLSAYTAGTALTSSEKANVAQGITSGQASAPTATGSLTIATASDNPAPGSIVADATGDTGGQHLARILKMNLTANGGDAIVKEMKITRLGISKDADVDYVYILDANGKVLAKNNSISSGVASFANSTGLFTVTSGQTVAIWLANDVNTAAAAGSTQGWTVDAANVKVSGTGTVTGSASSNVFTVASVTDLGQLEVSTSTPVTATSVDAGKTGYTLNTFKFKSIDQELLVKSVKLTNIGTIAVTDLQNIQLMIGGVQYGDKKAKLDADNTISFDLTKDSAGADNADKGLKILAGQTKFVDVVGDIVGGTNRTFAFSIQNQEDVVALDNNYKVYVPVAYFNANTFSVQTHANTTINTGKLTTSIATDSPNTNLPVNGSSVTIGKFNWVASGEDVKVTTLTYQCTSGDLSTKLKNVKALLSGVQVGSTDTSITCDGGTDSTALTFSNNFVIKTGQTSVLEIVADLTDTTVAANDTVSITLNAGSGNAQGQTSLASVSTISLSGYTLTLKSGAPTVASNPAFYDATTTQPSGVLNDQQVKIGSFIISAGAGEGAKISSIIVGDYAGALSGLFNNMRLQHNGADIATAQGTLSAASSTYTYTLNTPQEIAAGQNYIVDVVADVLSTTSTAAITAGAQAVTRITDNGITYQTLSTSQSGTVATGIASSKVFLARSGQMAVAAASDTPTTHNLVMGSTDQVLAKFRLVASTTEDVKVTEIVPIIYLSDATPVASAALSNLRLVDSDNKVVGMGVLVVTAGSPTTTRTGAPAHSAAAYVKFSSLSLNVPKNAPKTLSLLADISSVPNTLSSSSVRVYLAKGYDTGLSAGVVATGAKSGQSITVQGYDSNNLMDSGASDLTSVIRGNLMYIYRTNIAVANATNAPSGASSASTQQAIARFVVSNTANVNNAQATIDIMNIRIDSTISLTAGAVRFFTVYKVPAGANEVWNTSYDVGPATDLNKDIETASQGACVPGTHTSTASAYSFTSCPPYLNTNFEDVVIDANSYVTFVATFDTSDASSNKTLTAVLPTSSIIWSDGQSTLIPYVDGIPVNGKTLVY